MYRVFLHTIVAGLAVAAAAPAQTARFGWQQGQVLTYRVEHISLAAEVIGKEKTESKTKLNLTKRWQVLEVDSAGMATLQLSLAALRLETTTPSGGTILFDSADPDKGDAHLREELGRFVGQPLAVLRLDGQGKVVEVKESRHGPASRYENELPFVLVLPDEGPRSGQTWERAYQLTLEPPQGTGDKYDAVQKYVCNEASALEITVALTTEVKTHPESLLDRVPLLQMQPEGEVVFDVRTGRLKSARLRIDKELAGHQGEGSTYRFQSTYTEELISSPASP